MAEEYGVTATGYHPKTQEVIRAETEADIRDRVGNASLPLGDRTLLGALNAMYSEREATLWELGEVLAGAGDPDASTATILEAVCAITGTTRAPASPTKTTETLTGDALTVVPEGSQVQTTNETVTVATDEDATLVALSAWASATGYVADDRVTNGGNAYVCITAGTSAGSGGPLTEAADITDGTAHWRWMGEGAAAVDVGVTATATGALVAVSGDLSVIVTPVAGWNGAINLTDANTGSEEQTDEELRDSREEELSGGGTSTPDAIREELLDVGKGTSNPVESVSILYNPTSVTDVDNLPPRTVEAIVYGGEDQDIRDRLLARCIAAGIGTHGTTTGTATDSEGTEHTIKFTRPEDVPIYVDMDVDYDQNADAAPDEDEIKIVIAEYGDALGTAHDVRARPIGSQVLRSVANTIDTPAIRIGIAPSPTLETTIIISKRQRASFDTANITVNPTAVAP